MKLATCLLLICCLVGFTHSKSSNAGDVNRSTDGAPDKLFDALIARIDHLEEKQEARDRLHQTEIDQLRHEHETEIEKLRHDHQTDVDFLRQDLAKQTVRVNELEITVRRQDDKIKDLVNTPDDTTTSTGQDGRINMLKDVTENTKTSKQQGTGNQSNSASVSLHREQAAISRNRIRRFENEVDVAFFATLTTATFHIGTNQDIAFDHVVTNIGNSYNPHVGVFVAPVAGTYVFAVTLETRNRDQAHYGLFRNLEQITGIWVNGFDNSYDVTSQTAILHLSKGDDVTIRHLDSDHALTGGNQCMFSGFLLSQDATDSSPIVGK